MLFFEGKKTKTSKFLDSNFLNVFIFWLPYRPLTVKLSILGWWTKQDQTRPKQVDLSRKQPTNESPMKIIVRRSTTLFAHFTRLVRPRVELMFQGERGETFSSSEDGGENRLCTYIILHGEGQTSRRSNNERNTFLS